MKMQKCAFVAFEASAVEEVNVDKIPLKLIVIYYLILFSFEWRSLTTISAHS